MMFNRKLKKRLHVAEYQLSNHEHAIEELMMDIIKLKGPKYNQTNIHFIPFNGYKIMFTFDNPDGSANGGVCTDPNALPKLFQMVKDMKGANLVIKDESFYMKIHKSSHEDSEANICETHST